MYYLRYALLLYYDRMVIVSVVFYVRYCIPKLRLVMDILSKRVLEILSSARVEAQQLQQNYVGSEHILLGLLHQEGSAAIDVIKSFGVEPSKLRDDVLFIIDRPDRMSIRDLGFTFSATETMELAVVEVEHLGKSVIGTIPILLGLVLERFGIAAAILESYGITPVTVRLSVRQVLSQRDDS